MQVCRELHRSFKEANAPDYCSASVDHGVACSDIARHVGLKTNESVQLHQACARVRVPCMRIDAEPARAHISLDVIQWCDVRSERNGKPAENANYSFPTAISFWRAPGASRRSTVRKRPR